MLPIVIFTFSYLFFLAALIGLSRARNARLRELARNKFFCARYGRLALLNADKHLHTGQIGLFLSAAAAGLFFTYQFDYLLNPVATAWVPFDRTPIINGVLITLLFLVYLALVFPALHLVRAIALARPNRTLCVLSIPLLYFSKILQPVVFIFNFFAKFFGGWFAGMPISEREHFASADEINEIVDKSTKAGQIEEDEREMIKHVFTFRDTVVREVMTPRKDIISVSQDVSLEQLTQTFVGERLSRVLVIGETLDDVKGVILAKDMVPFAGRIVENFDVQKIVRPAYFVPSTKNVDQLLEEFRNEGKHFAVVLDEHGGVDGVVTLEDLVEEIVGEIFDEYDNPLDEAGSYRTRSGDTLVDGGMNIHDFNAMQRIKLPEGPYDTVAGFIIQQFGRLPQIGEEIEWEGSMLKVENVEDTRVTLVRVTERSKLVRPLAA